MKAIALQSTSDSGPARTRQKTEAHCAPVSPWFTQPASALDEPVVQRKSACACGGGCPRCEKESDDLKVQTKLAISTPGDEFEQEADRVADQVLAAPAHSAVSSAPPRIQGFTGQSAGQADTAPASVDQVLASPGSPLDPGLRQDMEQGFGHDFSRVRVHSGTAADQSARDVNANAYTTGHNIVFGAGGFVPGTHDGRRLIAHELAHVIQQSGSAGLRVSRGKETRGLSPISTGISRTWDGRKFPLPTVADPMGTVMSWFVINGTLKVSPENNNVTVSEKELEFEFERLGKSIIFKLTEKGVTFSSKFGGITPTVSQKISITPFPPDITVIYSSEKEAEVKLQRAGLNVEGTLSLELHTNFHFKTPLGTDPAPEPSPLGEFLVVLGLSAAWALIIEDILLVLAAALI